jgi:hypothetical protein
MDWVMVFNATFNNISVISWRSVLLVEKIERGKLCTFEPHYHKLEQIVSLDNSELKNLFIYISLINPKYIN